MSEVYDAYEKVYGANSLKASREYQAQRLYGMDLDGNKIGDSVADRVAQYFGRDKYIFVNKNNHTNIPLSQDQLKNIAAYCAEKNISVFDFVINDMDFNPDRLTAAERKAGGIAPPPFNITTSWPKLH